MAAVAVLGDDEDSLPNEAIKSVNIFVNGFVNGKYILTRNIEYNKLTSIKHFLKSLHAQDLINEKTTLKKRLCTIPT